MVRCILAAVLLALSLASCGVVRSVGGDPVKTSLPENFKGRLGSSSVAVCYVDGDPRAAEIVASVRELCKEPGSTVSFHSNDLWFNDCPVMKKHRAVYFCTAPPVSPRAVPPAGQQEGPPSPAGPLRSQR